MKEKVVIIGGKGTAVVIAEQIYDAHARFIQYCTRACPFLLNGPYTMFFIGRRVHRPTEQERTYEQCRDGSVML